MRVMRPETEQFLADMEVALCAHGDLTIPTGMVRDWFSALASRLGPWPAPTAPDSLRSNLNEMIMGMVTEEMAQRDRARALHDQMEFEPQWGEDVPFAHVFLETSATEAAATSNTIMRLREQIQLLLRRAR